MSRLIFFVLTEDLLKNLELSDCISYVPTWNPKFKIIEEYHQVCIKTDAATADKIYDIRAHYSKNIYKTFDQNHEKIFIKYLDEQLEQAGANELVKLAILGSKVVAQRIARMHTQSIENIFACKKMLAALRENHATAKNESRVNSAKNTVYLHGENDLEQELILNYLALNRPAKAKKIYDNIKFYHPKNLLDLSIKRHLETSNKNQSSENNL